MPAACLTFTTLEKPPVNRTDRNLLLLLGAAFVAGVTVAAATGAFATRPELPAPGEAAPAEQTGEPAPTPGASTLAASEEARRTPIVEAVERVAPAVVSITTSTPVQSWFGTQNASSDGSGVVIDASGLVLTNAHVVAQAQTIKASFVDGAAYEARVLGLDENLDLAVLQLEGARDLVAVPIGSSAGLMLGEPVIAIGNPYGLGHTVTTGVVSSLHRSLETRQRVYQDFLQTDASINPGNSGGPLLDIRGRLIGINTAIYAEGQNIGFAIPSDRAIKIAKDLAQFGTVQAPWLGVDLLDLSVRTRDGVRGAVKVSKVYSGTGAERGGLQVGDVLVEVDGRAIQGRGDLNAYLATYDPGQVVRLVALRGESKLELSVSSQALAADVVDRTLSAVLGVEIAEYDSEEGLKHQPRVRGVVVTRATQGGAWQKAGLRAGDVIAEVSGQRVTTTAELRQILLRAKIGHRGSVLVTVWRGPSSGRFELPI